VPDGEWGSLTITTLDRDNGLLRYNLEEAVRIITEPCVCGETTIRGLWGGRLSHLVSSQGKRFQPIEVERALRGIVEVAVPSVQYVVVRPQDETAPLRVRVEEGADPGDLAATQARCRSAVQQRLGIAVALELVARDTLPRSGYKAVRLVDS
jgi:phenylacetate-CoA ligase